jgi:hypothetical protein
MGKSKLPPDELREIEDQVARLEPKVPVRFMGTSWMTWQSMTFSAAYENAARLLGRWNEPVFKLKAKPARFEGTEYDAWRVDSFGLPRTPGEAILRTSIYGQLRWLLSPGFSSFGG